jgi:hypothetical protein
MNTTTLVTFITFILPLQSSSYHFVIASRICSSLHLDLRIAPDEHEQEITTSKQGLLQIEMGLGKFNYTNRKSEGPKLGAICAKDLVKCPSSV